MPALKVPFGLKNGRLVGTDEVDRGLACECICPECGAALEAHKGNVVTHHFAHHIAKSCSYSLESALHLGAKQILLEGRKFAVPALEVFACVTDRNTGLSGEASKQLPSKLVEFTEVRQEVNLGGVVADIYAICRDRPLIIEIAVTHFCDEEKIRRIEQLGLPVVELDLSHLKPPITMADLRTWVVQLLGRKKWLVNPRRIELQKAAEEEAKANLQRILTEEAKWAPNKGIWDRRYKTWTCAEKLDYALNRLRLTEGEIPAYLNHKTRGDRAFPCNRRVWQTAVFADFIYRKVPPLSVSAGYVAEWLADGFEIADPYPYALKVAIWDFLSNLERVGCLERTHRQEFTIRLNSIPAINAAAKRTNSQEVKQARSAADIRKAHIANAWLVPLNSELVWAPTWSNVLAQDAIIECKREFGSHQAWESLLKTLLPEARSHKPLDLAQRYAAVAGLHPDQVLRALILAGFVIELPF